MGVDVQIAPDSGETFAPMRITEVIARSSGKILAAGVVDANHAIMRWDLNVEGRRLATGPVEACHIVYHEMVNGNLFELRQLPDGSGTEIVDLFWCPGDGGIAQLWTAAPFDGLKGSRPGQQRHAFSPRIVDGGFRRGSPARMIEIKASQSRVLIGLH